MVSGGSGMISSHARLAVLISAALVAPHAFASHVHRAPTSGQSGTHKLTQQRRHTVRRARGQQAIEPERVTQIQQALIREHYLSSDANGKWDTTTQAAMQKFQADNGWQTKLMPDSRAIKKLGLGPDYSTAINAKTGNFTPSTSASNIPAAQSSGFTAASGVKE
jgi:peptidoglycan hydrolase-like protein with peptidoglycan-binding domain